MALNPQAYKQAAYPPPISMPKDELTLPALAPDGFRRFLLRWNSRKTRGRNPRKNEWQECFGVLFPAGSIMRVALSNGQLFQSLDDLERVLGQGGDFTVDYLDK